MRPSTVTTPRPSACGLLEGGDDPPGQLDLVGAGAKTRVARLDLARVDQRLAVEAQLPALRALGQEAGLVLDVVVDAVEDHLAGGAGGEQAQAEAVQQRLPAGHVLGVQLLGEVVGAHHEHRRAARRRRRSPRRGASRSGVSSIAQIFVCVGRAAGLEAPPRLAAPRPRVFTLGTTTAAGPAAAMALRSSSCHGRADAVGPDGQLAAAVAAAGDRGAHALAGLGLGVGGDGVLEVEDQRVGGDVLRLLEGPLVGARHVEDGAARAQAASSAISPPRSRRRASASSGSRAASCSASSSITWHCFTEASSSIFPSSITAPVPSPIAAMTRRAWRTSAGSGENTLLGDVDLRRGGGSRRRRSRAGRRCGTGPRRRRRP